jgi:dienelactone hydrolase
MRGILAVMLGLLTATPGFNQTGQEPGTPELTGSLSYEVSSRSGAVQNIVITVGDGGSGPYKSVLRGDPGLTTHAIYRPRDLQPFGDGNKMPIVVWANGGCRNSSGEFRNFLAEIASHGFLVIAIGPAMNAVGSGSEAPGTSTKSSQLLDAVAWATAENSRAGSDYFGKVETSKVAVMGQSCGGLQAIEVSGDPRVTTTVIWNSGVLNAPPAALPQAAAAQPSSPAAPGPARGALPGMPRVNKDALASFHAPVAYFIGGKSDIAHANAVDDFSRINNVPVFMANRDVGHYPATYREPRGGAFAAVGAAWLKWQLKGDRAAAGMFIGEKCGLCGDPKWVVEKKGLE